MSVYNLTGNPYQSPYGVMREGNSGRGLYLCVIQASSFALCRTFFLLLGAMPLRHVGKEPASSQLIPHLFSFQKRECFEYLFFRVSAVNSISFGEMCSFSTRPRDFFMNVALVGFLLRRRGRVTSSSKGSQESDVHDEISQTIVKPSYRNFPPNPLTG